MIKSFFLIAILALIMIPSLALATTEPDENEPVNNTPIDSGVCTANVRNNNVCLGTLTSDMCEKFTTGQYQNNICIIGKDEFKLTKYIQVWIDAYLLNAALAISFILILAAGVMFMLSGTDPGKANLAKDIIFTTLSGLIFLYLARFVYAWIVK